ncbi:MAG: hypothetical protein VYB09_00565 [Planctomycetota bacterium]|nr:hypothetical protein [Planctomycetota bacterium]
MDSRHAITPEHSAKMTNPDSSRDKPSGQPKPGAITRRQFHGHAASTAVAGSLISSTVQAADPSDTVGGDAVLVDDFLREDTFYHGDGWESLNPGYWKIEKNALRRRIRTRGDRARQTGFPYHYSTHQRNGGVMNTEYLSSHPYGMLWRRDWSLSGGYTIAIKLRVVQLPEPTEGFVITPGDALMGICFGAKTRMESWLGGSQPGQACWMAAWRDNQTFGVYDHSKDKPTPATKQGEQAAPALKAGDEVEIFLQVKPTDAIKADITAEFLFGDQSVQVRCTGVDQEMITKGYFGVVGRGLLDFEVTRVRLAAEDNEPIDDPVNELRVAYALGNTLRQNEEGNWTCRMMAVFRDQGELAEVRVSTEEKPQGGWENVPAAGQAPIVTNNFRRATAAIDVVLPENPGDTAMYYTVWKDGKDVTGDPRSGFLGSKQYVGRLPQLSAPYRLAGLSCHAIHGQFDGGRAGKFQENWIHDQPAVNAYKFLDEYNFQVMVWEDDIWYLELLLYTTSVDDAYLQIMTAMAGPTTRWQMMRHWNTLNPGDHDHGMDDVKGPEQLAIRNRGDLGQDPEYMRRNFQIVQHLVRGDENPSGTTNPRRWTAWKMPHRDFTLVLVDARLWRSSQDTHIWATEGWGGKDVYDRTDPTRSLLGEEQFSWLENLIQTDSSPLIALSGINGLHTVWEPSPKLQRDRVVADYAGWVKAGCDRVIELLGSRNGIVSVYGDVHNGSIMKNREHQLYECSFGPIGRTGGRKLKPMFGRRMKDYDNRELDVIALYHKEFESPDMKPRTGPQYWNFLEMEFDPRQEGTINLKIRNLIDPPDEIPRGGGWSEIRLDATGRAASCRLPEIKTLPVADVHFSSLDGRPIRASRSSQDGSLTLGSLIDIEPGSQVVMLAVVGDQVDAQLLTTLPLEEK